MSDEDFTEKNNVKSKFDQSFENIKSGAVKTSKVVAENSKIAMDSAARFASEMGGKIAEKKEQMIETRKKQKTEFIESLKEDEKYKQIIVNDEKLPKMVSLPVTEHQELLTKIETLEKEVNRLESLVEDDKINVGKTEESDIESPDEEPKKIGENGLSGEVNKSINQILITLGFSVVWAIVLIVTSFQLEQNNITFSGLGSKAIVWPIGTAIWTMFLLTSQSKVGTILSMDMKNRAKTSIGVGLATILSLMLTDGEMRAITNIWGWAMTLALCAFLLSGFIRGVISSFRNISNKMSFSN
ncbi:MAG: hypothetical protein CMB20_000550 [Methanobacteriota archaeon]|nr:MAG: hypothetical protein CMB20_000550 [Euryarchaeota archaeon]